MPGPYMLSEDDRAWMQKVIQDYVDRLGNPTGRPDTTNEPPQAPETYIALTPSTGIPAIDQSGTTGTGTVSYALDDVPGSAVCRIYRLIRGTFRRVGPTKLVYNLSRSALPGNAWILVTRDKFGTWIIPCCPEDDTTVDTDAATGTGTGTVGCVGVVYSLPRESWDCIDGRWRKCEWTETLSIDVFSCPYIEVTDPVCDFADCPPIEDTGTGTGTAGCMGCTDAAIFTVTLSTISCGQFNNTYDMTYVANCQYSECILGITCATLDLNVSPATLLFGAGPNTARYEFAGSVNCIGDTVFDFISSTGTCTGWPATVTVTGS